MNIPSFRCALTGLLTGLALGVAATAYLGSMHREAKETKQAQTITKNTVVEGAVAVRKDAVVTAKVDAIGKDADGIKSEIARRLAAHPQIVAAQQTKVAAHATHRTKSETAPAPAPVCQLVDGSSIMPFDVGTVRLLNAARLGLSADSVSLTDAESAAPATVTVQQFTDNDTEIAKLYNQLAVKHNEMVDQVEAYQAKQAKELGIKVPQAAP